jgi:hypothetical protein
MNKNNINAGMELLYLLRQQRYLYHQLKILAERQQQLPGTNSPEMVLEVISGRRKLIEKLRELEDKLRPIKANWQKLSGQIGPECKSRAHEITVQIQEIINEITENAPSEMIQHLPLDASREFDELLAEA